jgi:hypothetical protein
MQHLISLQLGCSAETRTLRLALPPIRCSKVGGTQNCVFEIAIPASCLWWCVDTTLIPVTPTASSSNGFCVCSLLRPCSRALCNHQLLSLRLEDWDARTSMRMACSGPLQDHTLPRHTSCQTTPRAFGFSSRPQLQSPGVDTRDLSQEPRPLPICGLLSCFTRTLVPDIGRRWISPRLPRVHRPSLVKPHIPLTTGRAKTPHNHRPPHVRR